MEYYATAECKISPEKLQQIISVTALPKFCSSIYETYNDTGESGEINTIWGVFIINREVINGGLRFSLPACPNTVAWTVTSGLAPNKDKVEMYLTIRRNDNDDDFLESIEEFVKDWINGLEENFK